MGEKQAACDEPSHTAAELTLVHQEHLAHIRNRRRRQSFCQADDAPLIERHTEALLEVHSAKSLVEQTEPRNPKRQRISHRQNFRVNLLPLSLFSTIGLHGSLPR